MKTKYTRKDGLVGECEGFMKLPKLSPGHVWYDAAPLGECHHEWEERPEPYTSPYLFGYLPDDLLAKQYK